MCCRRGRRPPGFQSFGLSAPGCTNPAKLPLCPSVFGNLAEQFRHAIDDEVPQGRVINHVIAMGNEISKSDYPTVLGYGFGQMRRIHSFKPGQSLANDLELPFDCQLQQTIRPKRGQILAGTKPVSSSHAIVRSRSNFLTLCGIDEVFGAFYLGLE